ncbi:hypothetical protein [uncultured Lutibacter sp.]|uniref:hypothetical protein n=1 Tax=uncultured Lutibacter sp. TaxID=437739 RepID=UPI002612C9E7|nr:hypothetical protein [uncultured Lutibacter sp.]
MYIGKNKAFIEANVVAGEMINLNNESYYKISNVDQMRPFFMSIVSDSNHWMFIASNGGLSAGRKNSDLALFPYYTDDKITESFEITGSKTILKIEIDSKKYLWEPFSETQKSIYNISRNLYKNSYGNKLIFEEINNDLSVIFRYEWNSSNRFGFVKKSTIINNNHQSIQAQVLDGIQNIVPYGVSAEMQNTRSNLVDAYKKNELEEEVGIGIYALSAIIVDKAEPSEALKATIAWSLGIKNPTYLLSSLQLNNFRKEVKITQETDIKAEKGAYFTCFKTKIASNNSTSWMQVANVNQTISAICEISEQIKNNKNLQRLVEEDIDLGTKRLIELSGNSDGIQLTSDTLVNTRHFSNTLFNIMRGGIFDDNYQIEKKDFTAYILNANKKVYKKKEQFLKQIPNKFSLELLRETAKNQEDKNFRRLCFEYLPLKFSRRHGDPSRPWNKFSINTKSEIDGSKILDYEGNWRDIFQNWEALAHSYPNFIEGMIHKFLNATTFEGYNPYRVTKTGFDWEVIEPNDPWSFIGYWGDHQIIYLLKFLEFSENYFPNELSNYFNQDLFVYANVPYKIKSYSEILNNPKDTIEFDVELNEKINQKKLELGSDGALLRDENFFIHKVNLIEKLLVPVLAKISNFIPEAGIWLNTQRPEWNDANNALVGNGVSMVTLYYLNRFITFFEDLVQKNNTIEKTEISEELYMFFKEVVKTFTENEHVLNGKISDRKRKTILDGLATAGSSYRMSVYNKGFTSNKIAITKAELLEFFKLSKFFIDHTIRENKREDKLYHSYNLIYIKNELEISISHLPEMLEGQVAVLSSGAISTIESLEIIDSLRNSALYREDQNSYLLYPNKELARFTEKNTIPKTKVNNSKFLQTLLKNGNTQIIEKDIQGNYHFNGNFNNVKCLKKALLELNSDTYSNLILKEKEYLFSLFEEVFNHKAFTGRSGTFFGYEGLGSIYWHMVSKLLLAVQENCVQAVDNNESIKLINQLNHHYHEINKGIGVHKSPKIYGAFPTDPYSHTPAGKGAQQPGMTGQVKEDVICRYGELGILIKDGKLHFNPFLLKRTEFLQKSSAFKYTAISKELKELILKSNSLCFTYCQIPIIYKLGTKKQLEVIFSNGAKKKLNLLSLPKIISNQIFSRTGEIEKIIVSILK